MACELSRIQGSLGGACASNTVAGIHLNSNVKKKIICSIEITADSLDCACGRMARDEHYDIRGIARKRSCVFL